MPRMRKKESRSQSSAEAAQPHRERSVYRKSTAAMAQAGAFAARRRQRRLESQSLNRWFFIRKDRMGKRIFGENEAKGESRKSIGGSQQSGSGRSRWELEGAASYLWRCPAP